MVRSGGIAAPAKAKSCVLACMAVLAIVCSAMAYPKPAPVPYKWELQFEPGDLRLWQDKESGDHFWFFTYTVTNRTGKDQLWAPKLTLFTDGGEILEAGRDVPTRVTEGMLELLDNELLQDQNEVLGEIFQGRENAKEGLVIWPAKNLNVNQISLFIAGISGETARVKNPVSSEEVILRKTLQRDYLVPGNAVGRGTKPVELVSQTWILR
jgi:hypothetical protein